MTHLLALDSEQMDIIRESLRIPQAFLSFRLRRADPEGILSDTFNLQRNKIRNIEAQAELGPLPNWQQLPKGRQDDLIRYMEELIARPAPHTREVIFNEIMAIILRERAPKDHAPDEPQPELVK